MIYVYASMLLHKSGKEINENNIKKVLESVDIKPDDAKLKAVVAALSDVDIDKAIAESAAVAAVAAPVAEAKAEKKEKPEEKKASEEEAAAGLGSLFG